MPIRKESNEPTQITIIVPGKNFQGEEEALMLKSRIEEFPQ